MKKIWDKEALPNPTLKEKFQESKKKETEVCDPSESNDIEERIKKTLQCDINKAVSVKQLLHYINQTMYGPLKKLCNF